MNSNIVIISNDTDKTYFKSKNHTQSHGKLTGYVPVTHYYPSIVKPRPSLPNGVINSVEDVITIFYHDYKEIPNPI